MINLKKYTMSLFIAGVLISTPPIFPSYVNDTFSLAGWLFSDFTYQREVKGDYWKTPKETIRDKGGDCEDFAILAQHVLKKLGYKTYLIGLKYKEIKAAHLICVIKHKDKTFSYFSNTMYDSKRYSSIPELLTGCVKYDGLTWKIGFFVFSKNKKLSIPLWRNKLWNTK